MGEIEIGDLIVEWDDNKAELNWKKHKIYFEDAAYVFLDDDRIEDYDEYEDRWQVIGKVRGILVVIYTERGEKYRIISARYATTEEEDKYYGQYKDL